MVRQRRPEWEQFCGLDCCACGERFGVKLDRFQRCMRTGAPLYCSNGHKIWLAGATESMERTFARLERQLTAKEAALESLRREAEHYKRSAASYKGKLQRVKEE